MELLVIKYGDKYVRIKEGEHVLCSIQKTSVFPITDLEEVKYHVLELGRKGHQSPKVYKLVLHEEELEERR